MTKAIDVANFIIVQSNVVNGRKYSNLELNKALYFIQGMSLAKTGNSLFSDNLEAWEHGPVVCSVWNKFTEYGNTPITKPANSDFGDLSTEDLVTVFNVMSLISKMSAKDIYNAAHDINGPWARHYHKGVKRIEIPLEDLKEYFKEVFSGPTAFDKILEKMPVGRKIDY